MAPRELLRSLYLGDRACKAIIIDGWNNSIRLQVDCISRIRSPSGEWDFHSDEDILDGFIVFGGADRFELLGGGRIPNDSINSVEVVSDHGDSVTVELSVDAVDADANRQETLLRVRCKSVHLEDPARPGVRIDS